jgi:cytochrome c
MRTSALFAFTSLALSGLAACGSTEPAPAPTPVEAQLKSGGAVYGANCAKCHGNAGQGTKKAPAIVGPGALPKLPRLDQKVRRNEFRTAMDVATFVTANMPPDEELRAKMQEQQYWDVLAFALNANGVKLQEPVGPHNAAGILLHP